MHNKGAEIWLDFTLFIQCVYTKIAIHNLLYNFESKIELLLATKIARIIDIADR